MSPLVRAVGTAGQNTQFQSALYVIDLVNFDQQAEWEVISKNSGWLRRKILVDTKFKQCDQLTNSSPINTVMIYFALLKSASL